MPKPEFSKWNPNRCEHPYKKVEEQIFTVQDPNGYVVAEEEEVTVCTGCGYVLEQSDELPKIKCIGSMDSKYPPEQ